MQALRLWSGIPLSTVSISNRSPWGTLRRKTGLKLSSVSFATAFVGFSFGSPEALLSRQEEETINKFTLRC